MQAVSGAGYPGVASLDILGNVVPFISGEEEKMQSETLKILGSDGGARRTQPSSARHTNRVAVIDGHTITVSVAFERKPAIEAIKEAMRSFAGKPQELWLPSAPQPPLCVTEEPNRPQPRLDADLGGGMAITIGRVRECPVMHAKFVALGHNTIRGAAGAAILNAELMHSEGMLG
jgi:aspartate-semialdehyde dehydrogenase